MTKFQSFIFFLLFASFASGQDVWMKSAIKPPLVECYASPEVHQVFVKPPVVLKSASAKKTTIEVVYIGFPDEAKAAFQYAVNIWKDLIYSPVPIHVKATWESLDKDVLGSCSPTNFYTDFNSTQIWNCYYPVALVEKMLGKEVNSTDYEIEASFNKDFTNWYFGTDGHTPVSKYDFASTVLHELAHGLGFHGFFHTDNRSRGTYGGSDGFSAAFDQFVQNRSGEQLVNTNLFANPSVKLYQNFTSGWLVFNSKLNEGSIPRLYAPTTWDSGSSIYHLNDATYPAGNENSLMTHAQSLGEANHDPGPKTLAILNDMGWKSVSIKHTQVKDIEFVSTPISFDAQLESDFDLDSTRIYLVYSTNKFQKVDSVLLKSTAVLGVFNAKITPVQNSILQYYFSASDVKKRTFVLPSNAPARYFSFSTGVDKTAPIVVHEPVKYILSSNPSVKIEATATDNIGIKSVNVEYFVNGGTIKELRLANDSLDNYSGMLTFLAGTVRGGDVVSYKIVATDVSSQSNIGKSPETGYHTFTVETIKDPVDKYFTNFNSTNSDFIGSDFSVSTPTGFDNAGLNSAHPYLSPETDNTNFNFTTILRYPVVLDSQGKMTFDEIALVEPGDDGAVFGSQNFFDYVIVEGSNDNGVNWKPLDKGWNCRVQQSWLDKWNSSMSGNNSTGLGTKDLFVKRTINMLDNGNFKTGDTILIRFRLFSDPYSHGWGWIIDNLAIQDIETATLPIAVSAGEVRFFPNPANDKLNISIDSQKAIQSIQIKAYKITGEMVWSEFYPVESNVFQATIDVSKFISGLYLFTIEPEKGQVITRKVVVK